MEYLYTDHSPIEDSDSIGILELANQYVMPRLTALCELYISKHVEQATSESIAKADVDIIGILQQLIICRPHTISHVYSYHNFHKRDSNLSQVDNGHKLI